MFQGIDFYSDTLTKPTNAMRKAIFDAEVGDEQKGEDPTTRQLETMAAEMLGHECAMFFPTATMANQTAIRLHCNPGDELIAAENAHVFFAEAGGPAVHSGVMAKPIATLDGIFDGVALKKAYRWAKGPHYPVSKLAWVENTTNMGGGVAWPKYALESFHATSTELGMKTHLDGARLFNAAVATGVSPKDLVSPFSTATICLSKGLGCPTGAILLYAKKDYDKVRRQKQQFGGAMRQSGILAAAGIYALTHNIDRLHEDHSNAARLAEGLLRTPHITVETNPPSTNMVYFRWSHPRVTAEQFHERCKAKGVRFSIVEPNRFRAVTHLDIHRDDVEKAVHTVKSICSEV
jgi:threonine aldolase